LEPAIYLHKSFAICCAAFLSQLQRLIGTELICLYIVLHLRLSEIGHFWKDGVGD